VKNGAGEVAGRRKGSKQPTVWRYPHFQARSPPTIT